MTEGPVTRTKRMGARFFKNPPQPHMCIRDYLKESWHACYINVLSWDKIEMATCPSDGLPLYGGMKINPPRTENPQSAVFFVMANPEILRRNGKNAQDPKEQSSLIELLLDFVEAMNEGVVFKRLYKVLDDRDITGELKEIWSIVQSDRAKAQDTFGSEDVMRPVPQYPQYQDQVQNQQKHQQQQLQQKPHHQQQPQQYRPPPLQQHQHHMQPMQTQHQKPQPPRFHFDYSKPNCRSGDKCENYDFSYTRQNHMTNNTQNDRTYQSRPVMNPNNANIRDRIYDYQYQQLPRPMGPPYPTPNCHPNPNLGCPSIATPGIPPVINHGVNPGPQIHYVSMHALENNVFVKLHRMQQPQQPQLQLAHARTVRRYETNDAFLKDNAIAQKGFMSIFRPQTNASTKNSSNKRQVNSPPHTNCCYCTSGKDNSGKCESPESNKRQINSPPHANCCYCPGVTENIGKSKSPIKVLQRDSSLLPSDKAAISEDTGCSNTNEKETVQVTDLDEDEPKGPIMNESDQSAKPDNVMQSEKLTLEVSSELTSANVEPISDLPQQSTSVPNTFGRDRNHKKQVKARIMVLKRNNSANDGKKSTLKDGKAIKNGVKCDVESPKNHDMNEKAEEKKQLENEQFNNIIPATEDNNGTNNKQINRDECPNDTPNIMRKTKKSNSLVSEITNNGPNGQLNGQTMNIDKKNDGVIHQVYTILRKPESTSPQEEIVNEMAQLSIKECTDSSEIGAVPS